jgi:hypothetical protein
MMQVYKLTPTERQAIEALSASRLNVLMVVCDMGDGIGCVVDYVDLSNPIYADYRALFGKTLDAERIVEWVPESFV